MGASASKSKILYSGNGYPYTLSASFNENSTNVANNTSNITCTATFSAGATNWETSYASTLIIYWHDNRENYDRQVASINFAGIAKYSSKTASGTINVTHKDDGTLSGYVYAVFTKGSTTTSWACNSGSLCANSDSNGNPIYTALTTIARASQPTLNATTFNIGDTITIYTNRKSTSFTHTVTFYFGNYSYQIATGVTDSVTFDTSTIANNMYQQIPNASAGQGNVTVTTYNGSTNIGNKNVLFTAKVTNSNPTFNASYQDINSTTTAITSDNQLIIRNNSNLQISVSNTSAKNYATLSTLTATINGTTYTGSLRGTGGSVDIGTLNLSSNTTAVVTLTDSRGISTNVNLSITILDWELPTAIINLQRENNYYSETNINVNAEYSSLDNLNTITIKTRYKKTTDTNYGAYVTLQDNVTTQLTLDNNYAWDVQVLLQDLIGSTTYNLSLDRGIPIFYIDRLKRSLGINCFPTNNTSLEVDGQDILDRIEGYGQIANQVTGDWNTACGTASGFYMGDSLSNSPTGATVGGWWWVIHIAHNNLYQRQIAFSFLNNSQMFTRIMNNGTWNSWTLVNQAMVTADSNAVATGRYVDGKPEYVKRITTNIVSGTNRNVSTGLTAGTHEIIDYKGYITTNDGTGIKVRDGFWWNSPNNYFMMYVENGNQIRVITGSDTSWITANHICIIEIYYIDIS